MVLLYLLGLLCLGSLLKNQEEEGEGDRRRRRGRRIRVLGVIGREERK